MLTHSHLKLAAWGGAVILGLVVGIGSALVFNDTPTPTRILPTDFIAQDAVAESNGVRVEVVGASFSGTETQLRLRVQATDEGAVRAQLGITGPIGLLLPQSSGFSGDFADGSMSSTTDGVGGVLVNLPPIAPPSPYGGSLTFRLGKLAVESEGERYELPGSWELGLQGPPNSAAVAAALRIETLEASPVSTTLGDLRIRGTRSVSRTTLEIEAPAGLTVLGPPSLRVDGELLGAAEFREEANAYQVSYPPTDFGKPIELQLSSLALAEPSETATLAVPMRAALDAAGDSPTFEFTGSVDERVIEGEQGDYGDRRWVGVVVSGNWHPENGEPVVTDARGVQLPLAHVQVEYRKDDSGAVSEGVTRVAAFVDADADLTTLVFTMGAPSHVDSTVRTIELRVE